MELGEAKNLVLQFLPTKTVEWISIGHALGRVLATTFLAPYDLPEGSLSRLDGYAVRSGDAAAVLKILPQVAAAGWNCDQSIESGECLPVLTGAPIPANADAVVPMEDVTRHGQKIMLDRRVSQGYGITARGQEVRRGEIVVSEGELLNPTRLALIAAFGETMIPVFAKPRVALLATGDEIIEVGRARKWPKSYCNNRYLLGWSSMLNGAVPIHLGVAKDDLKTIANLLDHAQADFVISTGGMGHGERDYTLRAWKMLGVNIHFDTINLVPGKNSAFGIKGERLFFGLPGNPWSARIVYGELIAPLLRRFQGLESSGDFKIIARLESDLKKEKGVARAFHGAVDFGSPSPTFKPAKGKSRSLFRMLRENSAYTILEPNTVGVKAGGEVQVCFHDLSMLSSSAFCM